MINPPAEILPPQLRARLIVAGQNHDTDEIDEIHALARLQYPELFVAEDNEAQWSRREARGTKKI